MDQIHFNHGLIPWQRLAQEGYIVTGHSFLFAMVIQSPRRDTYHRAMVMICTDWEAVS